MTLRRVVVSLVVVGVLGLSGCSSDKPSGLALFTPSATTTTPSPTPRSTSKWTPEQQQVIEGYDRFTDLQTAISTKALKVDMAKAHQVAKEPFATEYLKKLEVTLVMGFVQKGRVVNTVSAVTITGNTAILKTCVDQTHMSFSIPGNASAPPVGTRPPAVATVSLAREADSWLVSGSKGDEGACVSG
jgi:hypothetical protein